MAERDGRVVGSLMVTYEWSDWRNKCFWWIQSVYVEPSSPAAASSRDCSRRCATQASRANDVCGLRLYVEQHNRIAQATYKSLGMDETHYDMYEVELSVGRDACVPGVVAGYPERVTAKSTAGTRG